ncbi:MAG: hypothetical protein FWE20_01905 [Defluviitaleaceae bacterium]|nr:hypothetical protein [Defluviitaleaceae bacterium]
MAYETKALLVALSKILAKSESVEEAYEALVDIANTESVVLKPYSEAAKSGRKSG